MKAIEWDASQDKAVGRRLADARAYVLGNYPRAEITFMCLDKGDPELQRPKLQKTPDTVIELRKR